MASVSISANGVTTSPYTYSTATVSEKSRSGTSVTLNISIVTHLQYPESSLGTGYTLKGTITAYGVTKTVTLKNSSDTWSGSGNHTKTTTMSVTVPASTNAITIGYKIAVSGFESKTVTGTSRSLTLSKVLASVTSATSFNDSGNPTINFTNPGGFKLRPYLNFYTDSSASTKLLTLYPSGSSSTGDYISSPYTWSLTTSQRNSIRNALGTRTSCYVACGIIMYSGSTNIGSSSRGVTFTNVLSPPTFTNYVYEDIGGTTVDESVSTLDLTGDNTKIIKGYSKVKITINGDNTAVANKGASMSYYKINGTQYAFASDFSIIVDKYNLDKISIYAIDSRGISRLVEKSITNLISYTPINATSSEIARNSGVREETELSYSGSFWNDNFGEVNNELTISYKYAVTGSEEYITGSSDITPTYTDSSFSYQGYVLGDTISGFAVENSYNAIVTIKDKLSTLEYKLTLPSGIPAIAVKGNNCSVHGKYDDSLGGFQINGKVYLNGIPLIERNIITAIGSADGTYTTTTEGVRSLNEELKIGTRLSMSGGRIRIGKGVTKVKVGGQLYGQKNGTTNVIAVNAYVSRFRGGVQTNLYNGRVALHSTASYFTVAMPEKIVEVEEGDLFTIGWWKSSTESMTFLGSSRMFMTIEVVDIE